MGCGQELGFDPENREVVPVKELSICLRFGAIRELDSSNALHLPCGKGIPSLNTGKSSLRSSYILVLSGFGVTSFLGSPEDGTGVSSVSSLHAPGPLHLSLPFPQVATQLPPSPA